MSKLTEAEEQIMRILWKKQKAFVKDIIAEFPEPKPAYNTVSTVVRILEKKGIVGHESFGNTYLYYPILQANTYQKKRISSLVSQHFNGSISNLLSFFVQEENLSKKEIAALKKLIQNIDSND